MKRWAWRIVLTALLWLVVTACAVRTSNTALDAVLQTTDRLVQQLGWAKDDINISKVDTRDAQLGEALVYEFVIEIGGNVLPIRLAEEVSGWRYLEEDPSQEKTVALLPSNPAVLPPFELAGPVELWIQNSKDLRLTVPNEVDAGTVNRVLLADGATVTVTGAREVSVTKPFKVPLPLVKNGDTTSLSSLSEQLRFASRAYDKPVLSLRIVGATSLAASAPPPKHLDKPASSTRGLSSLKVKRLSPGAVELVNKAQEQTILPAVDGSSGSSWLWPLPSVHDSDAKVRNLDKALELSLGPNAGKKGFFNLLNAKASAARFIKVEFELEKRIDNQSLASWPEWRTKPSVQRLRFEVVAKLEDNNKVVPVAVKPVDPFVVFPAFDVSEASYNSNSNMTSTPTSIFLPPSSPLTMDFNNWDDI